MVQIRYILYFFGIAVLTWLLTQMEIIAPGSLKLLVYSHPGDTLGTSEYSPVEIIQVGILIVCGCLYAWVAMHCPSQRPIAIPFGGLATIFVIRELDYFLDRFVADNFWQVIMAVIAAGVIAYTYQHRRRFRIAWLRIWPSPGLTLLFAGAAILFAFVRLIGHEPLWMAILGDGYQRVVQLAVEELMEIAGYYFWLIGTIEYTYQARAIAMREPKPAVARRREGRRRKSGGKY
jgi:hypothetical protein